MYIRILKKYKYIVGLIICAILIEIYFFISYNESNSNPKEQAAISAPVAENIIDKSTGEQEKHVSEDITTRIAGQVIAKVKDELVRQWQQEEIEKRTQISSIAVSSERSNELTISWVKADLATNYYINLFLEDGTLVQTTHTGNSENSITFNNIEGDQAYIASVYAEYITDYNTYKSEPIYSKSFYLEHTPTLEETVLANQGSSGRLVIPDVNINVGLYMGYDTDDSQAIVNEVDSAAILTWWSTAKIIADHSNQGFDRIKLCIPGQTYAYIGNGDSITTYICTNKFTGHNTEYDLTDDNYNSITSDNSGGVTLYTCNDSWQNITIVYFQPI